MHRSCALSQTRLERLCLSAQMTPSCLLCKLPAYYARSKVESHLAGAFQRDRASDERSGYPQSTILPAVATEPQLYLQHQEVGMALLSLIHLSQVRRSASSVM